MLHLPLPPAASPAATPPAAAAGPARAPVSRWQRLSVSAAAKNNGAHDIIYQYVRAVIQGFGTFSYGGERKNA